MRKLFYTSEFKSDLDSFDHSVKIRIVKAISKIQEKPELGKPLHYPLNGFFAERAGKIRVIYKFDSNFVYLYRCRERDAGY